MNKFLFLFFFLISINSTAQHISASDFNKLKLTEDSMKVYSDKMINDALQTIRFEADSIFTRMLVRALKVTYSFSYPFDSIQTVSKLYAPDSSFRIFTWEFAKDETFFLQSGAIQMRTEDGSLKLFPLIDVSNYTANPVDSVRSNLNWIGAIYYALIMKTYNDKKYYTLLGYDDNDFTSTRKWIEVLTFNNDGKPQFGGTFFDYPEDSLKPPQPAYRFCLEYKKDARARLNYDRDTDMIIFDHLISEANNQNEKYTLIPDGDYEGFKWTNGKWKLISKVFTFQLQNGQAPMPAPLNDANGNPDEKKLIEQSEKKYA